MFLTTCIWWWHKSCEEYAGILHFHQILYLLALEQWKDKISFLHIHFLCISSSTLKHSRWESGNCNVSRRTTWLCCYTHSDQDFTHSLNIKLGVPQRVESLCNQNKCLQAQQSRCCIHLCQLLSWWERDTTCNQVQVINPKLLNCPKYISLCLPSFYSTVLHLTLN